MKTATKTLQDIGYKNPALNPLAVIPDFGAALDQLIENEATATKARDDYERTMVAVGRGIVLLHEAVIAKARGTPKPQEIGDYKRWMDYRGPEWFDLLTSRGKTVEWATERKRWDVDIEAAQGRRDMKAAVEVQQRENRKALISSMSKPVHVDRSSAPSSPRTIGSKTVSVARLNTEYVRIERLLARVDEEDREEALTILETCFAALRDLVGA